MSYLSWKTVTWVLVGFKIYYGSCTCLKVEALLANEVSFFRTRFSPICCAEASTKKKFLACTNAWKQNFWALTD